MKILVFSDIHGALNSALKIKELEERHHFDKMFGLGDFNYHGPRNPIFESYSPLEVVAVLNAYKDKVIGVKGNCDADIDDMLYDFDIKDYLVKEEAYYLTHGHRYDESYYRQLKAGEWLFYGHTHIPVAKKVNGVYVCNPGSLTHPKGGFEKTYGILDDEGFHVYDINDRLVMEVLKNE